MTTGSQTPPVGDSGDISEQVGPDELSASRRVSPSASESLTSEWAEEKDFAKPIDVLMTSEGLMNLFTLTQQELFINNVRTINFLYHSIPDLDVYLPGARKTDDDQSVELTSSQRLTLSQEEGICDQQQYFEDSGEALELCKIIFKALIKADKLEIICIGSRAVDDAMTAKRTLGFPELDEQLQLTDPQRDNYLELLSWNSPQPEFRSTLNIVLNALDDVNFSKEVIQIAIIHPQRPALHGNENLRNAASAVWMPLKRVQHCLRNVTIHDDNFHTASDNNSDVWLRQFILALCGSSVRKLTVSGCNSRVCNYCPVLIRALSAARLPHLQSLSLHHVVTDVKFLTTLLRNYQYHLKFLECKNVTLAKGEWKDVLKALLSVPKLEEVRLKKLWQEATKESIPHDPDCNKLPYDEYRAVFWAVVMDGGREDPAFPIASIAASTLLPAAAVLAASNYLGLS